MKKLLALGIIAGTALTACSGDEAVTGLYAGSVADTHVDSNKNNRGENYAFMSNSGNDFTFNSVGSRRPVSYFDQNGGFVVFVGTKDGKVTDVYADVLMNTGMSYVYDDAAFNLSNAYQTGYAAFTGTEAEYKASAAYTTDAAA